MASVLLALVLCVNSSLDESLPAYPGASITEVGNRVRTPRQEFRFGYAVLKSNETAVAKYFADKWTGEGLPIVTERTPDNHLLVAAFDTRRGVQQMVIVARSDGNTILLSTLADLRPDLSKDDFISRQSEAGVRLDPITWLDDSGETNQVNSHVEGDWETAKGEVTQRLQAQGYTLVRERVIERDKEVLFEHQRAGKLAVSLLRRVDSALTAVSQIIRGEHRE